MDVIALIHHTVVSIRSTGSRTGEGSRETSFDVNSSASCGVSKRRAELLKQVL